MKKAKMYVDVEPRKIAQRVIHFDDGKLNCIEFMFDNDIEQITAVIDPKHKTHDGELVKKVCERISRNVRVTNIQGEWFVIESDLRNILNKILKEYEGE